MKELMTAGSKLSNRLFVADYGGMMDESSRGIRNYALKLRNDPLALLENLADKIDKMLPSTKLLQFVQVENKMQVLLDLTVAASIPILTTTCRRFSYMFTGSWKFGPPM